MSLLEKSLTQLRGIAQSYDIDGIFEKDKLALIQAIESKHNAVVPKPEPIPQPEYDARLMTKIPAKKSNAELAAEILEPYVSRGLHVSYDDNEETWQMSFGVKNDTGTLRQPLRNIMKCADRLMNG